MFGQDLVYPFAAQAAKWFIICTIWFCRQVVTTMVTFGVYSKRRFFYHKWKL